ncbi:N-acetylmuramoyl-L-alanine amidase [Verrucomicrobiaceae bacterium 227]
MRTQHTIRNFLLLFLLTAFSAAAKVEFDVKEYRGQKYVPLSQVKDFYHFNSLTQSGSSIYLKNSALQIKFKSGGQEVLMNQVKFIFSNAIISIGGQHCISVRDLTKVVDPILRPSKIEGAKPFDTVVIDPGHGGRDSGGVSIYGKEATYNLNVGKLLRDHLRKRGFKVVMTRDSDVFLSLSKRVAIANRYKNAVFVSIHFNSAGSTGRSRASGIETFTLSPQGVPHYGRSFKSSDLIEKKGNEQDAANIALATAIHWNSIQQLGKAGMSVPDRGIRRARFTVISDIKHPAILLEGGFLSHPTESALIHRRTYQATLAKAIADAIYFYRDATIRKKSTGAKK